MATTSVAAQADRATVLDGAARRARDFEAFYGIVNNYDEPARPGTADVRAAATALAQTLGPALGQDQWAGDGPGLREGRTFRLGVSAGVVSCRSLDLRALDVTQDRAAERRRLDVDAEQRWRWAQGMDPECDDAGWVDDSLSGGAGRGEVTEWSAKSRARMVRALASLDYSAAAWPRSDGSLAMVTLTLPGWWQAVAATGRQFKALVRRFQERWRRNVGPWRCLWKLEFQGRGAPHWHGLLRVPALVKGEAFEAWLSRTWADVVGASREVDRCEVATRRESSEYSRHLAAGTALDFSGKDFSDPRRISMYFLGHSAKSRDGKEYQHRVPAEWQAAGAGPGRFWGYCGLERAEAEVDIDIRDFDRVRRELRKAARARAWVVACKRAEGECKELGVEPPAVSLVKGRRPRRSQYGGGGGLGGGWLLCNDGLAFAAGLVRFLRQSP